MSFAPFNNLWRKAPFMPYSSSDSGINLLPAPSHPPLQNRHSVFRNFRLATSIGLCWFRPPLQRRDRSRLSRDSLIKLSSRKPYSVLPHKANTTQNIVITARVCNKYFSILLYNYSFIISRKRGIYESFIKFNRKMQS